MSEFSTKFLIKQDCSGLSITNVIPTPIENGFLVEIKSSNIEEAIYSILDYCYDSHGEFKGQYCWVESAGLYGFVNLELKEVFSPSFQSIGAICEGFASIEIEGRWSYIDFKKGNVCRQLCYDMADDFKNGMGRVEKNGLYGFISKWSRDMDIACKYLKAREFCTFDGQMAAVQTGKGWILIDREDKPLNDQYFTQEPLDIGLRGCAVCVNGKWGVINRFGKYIIEPIFDKVEGNWHISSNYGYINDTRYYINSIDLTYRKG